MPGALFPVPGALCAFPFFGKRAHHQRRHCTDLLNACPNSPEGWPNPRDGGFSGGFNRPPFSSVPGTFVPASSCGAAGSLRARAHGLFRAPAAAACGHAGFRHRTFASHSCSTNISVLHLPLLLLLNVGLRRLRPVSRFLHGCRLLPTTHPESWMMGALRHPTLCS